MKDRRECARRVFADVQSVSSQLPISDAVWRFGPEDAETLGLSVDELGLAIEVLLHMDIFRRAGVDPNDSVDLFTLTHLGKNLCIHPELLASVLSPPQHESSGEQNITINAGIVQNTQIGHHNKINATTGTLTFSPAVPEGKRAAIERALTELRENLASVHEPEDRAEASATLAKVEQQLESPTPRLDRMKKYLELYAAIVTAASPTVEVLKQLLHALF